MNDEGIKEDLKPYLKEYVETITEPDKRAGRNMYKCPLCGSGSHGSRNSNGAFSITPDGLTWKCFSCQETGDIFNLIEKHEHITDFKDQLNRAKQLFNITEFTEKPIRRTRREPMTTAETKKADFTKYIMECKQNVSNTDFWHGRGLTDEIIERFNLGYDSVNDMAIIPYNKENSYYIARETKKHEFRKPKKEIAGSEPIYNLDDLYNRENKPVFICEGPIDALSLIQAGAHAVAIGGTGKNKLLTALEDKPTTNQLIISLDNDDPGKKATEELAKALREQNIDFSIARYTINNYPENKRKDPNDFLVKNFEQLKKDILLNTDPKAVLQLNSGAERLDGFVKSINDSTKNTSVSTGFKDLDQELDGGLFPGLYFIGAISSLGKTTLALNMADNLAERGQTVLYFSLEMGANELIAKSISKLTYTMSGKNEYLSKTNRGITEGKRYPNYSNTEKTLIYEALKKYRSFSNNLYFYEGIGNIGVEEIKATVKKHFAAGQKPIVFIDYLQILAPYDLRATDKQNTDKAVLELKRLSRDYDLVIVCISSFNRENYTTAVSMTAFKESGAIEYGSDVLIAIQPQGMTTGKGSEERNKEILNNCKQGSTRALEAVILKNRNGKTNGKINFVYNARFNYFEEGQEVEKIQSALDEWYNKKNDCIQM